MLKNKSILITGGTGSWGMVLTKRLLENDRIQNIIGDNDAKNIWMGTFHSVFSKILRIESHYINYPKNYTIYDTEDSKSLIRSIIKELNLNKDFYKVNIIRSRISTMKNNFISPDEYVNNPEIVLQDKNITRFLKLYRISKSFASLKLHQKSFASLKLHQISKSLA